jgi:hypothetical protein
MFRRNILPPSSGQVNRDESIWAGVCKWSGVRSHSHRRENLKSYILHFISLNWTAFSQVKVTLRLTVSQSVSQSFSKSWCRAQIWCPWPDIYFCLTFMVLFLWGALSHERMGLSFVHAADPCQHSPSQVQVPWDSWQYFTVSDLWLPFSSPPTTHRVTVEALDPTSTRHKVLGIQPWHGPHRKHCLQQSLHWRYGSLPSKSSDIVDMFASHYQVMHVPSHDCCLATVLHVKICNAFVVLINF